jgi:hypothetical protein
MTSSLLVRSIVTTAALATGATVGALSSAVAHADSLEANPGDPGHVTNIRKGVWEVDLGALGVLSSDHQGESTVTRLSTDASVTVSRFVRDNISVGVVGMADYDTAGTNNDAMLYGAALVGTLHLRLGMGAFFRPGLAIGGLFGTRHTPLTAGTVEQATQAGAIARVQLPLAYFTSKRFLIQAGPQLNVTAGRTMPMGKDAQSYTRIAGGFAVGAGYAF